MSSRGGSSSSNGGGLQSIPATSRKMVQSLKEIVNRPEPEIYATLKECNMDPNEAVSRLLTQDPFREVKSKKEKRKENKDTTDSRSRGVSHTSRGGKGSTDRYVGRGGSTSFSSYESGASQGKPAYKKESGTSSYTNPSPVTFESSRSHMNRQPPLQSANVTADVKPTRLSTVDVTLSSSQPAPAHQPAWSGVPGQLSMADIVKMGRPQVKTSTKANASQHGSKPQSYVPPLNTSEVGTGQHASQNDEWPLIEPPAIVNAPPPVETHFVAELHTDASNYPAENNQIEQSLEEDASEVEEADVDEVENAEHAESVYVSARKMDNVSEDVSNFSGDMHEDSESYQPHRSTFEHPEVEDQGASVSSVTSNLQQLNVKEVQAAPHEEDTRPVIIPDHLQVQSADCIHLSFGSFGTTINSDFPEPFSSTPLNSNIEEASVDASTVGHSETRNSEFYGDEPLRTAPDSNLVHRTGPEAGSFDSPSTSQNEMNQNSEASHDIRYTFPSSAPNYNFENAQQLNSAFPHSDTSSQMQNLASYSTAMTYTNSLPSSLLAPNVQSVRESDMPYSPFPAAQSAPIKYGNTMSSISGSTISVPEALKTAGFASAQPTAQALSGSGIATGPALPQHLAVHPYPQPTVPLGPFTNMIGYPFLPQNYTYMPSAFQQAFAGNSTYHQTLAAMLPQFKNSVSVSSLPQSAAIASGYGGFGSSTSIPGNFQMNPQAAPGPTTIGYDELLSSQYKDNSNLMSHQQNENSGMWVHGPGSRTMPAVPANTFYSFQGQQSQQPPSGFRQAQQQPSQSYASPGGYPNFYHSQAGMSLDHQQQNPRDGGSQGGQPSKQSQQIWQNGY